MVIHLLHITRNISRRRGKACRSVGSSSEEVLAQVASHAKAFHNLETVTQEVV
jgi:hypothetical protein